VTEEEGFPTARTAKGALAGGITSGRTRFTNYEEF